MATDTLGFHALPGRERRRGREGLAALGRAGVRGRVEIAVVRPGGKRESVDMPKAAIALFRDLLEKMVDAERIAVLREDIELTPEQAAAILGVSRPLAVKRMDDGRLRFRYVGTHRRCRLSDVLKLRSKERARRGAIAELAADTEDLMRRHGL